MMAATPTRTLRSSWRKNYRELVVVKLPKEKKRKEKTPRSQIQCCVSGRVKIYYIGFSQDFDEWRDPSDIVPLYEGSGVDDPESPYYYPSVFTLNFVMQQRRPSTVAERNHHTYVSKCHSTSYSLLVV